MLQPGQMVVCDPIDEDTEYLISLLVFDVMPQKKTIYTVERFIAVCPECRQPHITLEEITCKDLPDGHPAWWFRPVQKPSIDVFTQILAPTPKEPVPA